MSKGQPAQRGPLLFDDDFTIVAKYGSEYRGFVQYYLLAQDVFRLDKLHWVMETSMLKTLAGKHKSTAAEMARKYKATIDTGAGSRTCFQVTVPRESRKPLVARFGGIPLTRQRTEPGQQRRGAIQLRDEGRKLIDAVAADAPTLLVARQEIAVDHRGDRSNGRHEARRELLRQELRHVHKAALLAVAAQQQFVIEAAEVRLQRRIERHIGAGRRRLARR